MPKKQKKVKIAFVDSFTRMHDGEYIAQGFEHVGCTVLRIDRDSKIEDIREALLSFKPDVLLFCKWQIPTGLQKIVDKLRFDGMVTVCWVFDLYWGYNREYQIKTNKIFRADYVFTTDGGHDKEWKDARVNHYCVRQGIRTEECFIQKGTPRGIAFVGSHNAGNLERIAVLNDVKTYVREFFWYGLTDTEEIRGVKLNELYGNTKVVLGDSVYSPYYWSNRVVETLGRGGFLIHCDVPGLKESFPDLITYGRGDLIHLRNLISWYFGHEDERLDILQKNYDHVKKHHTVEQRCQDILDIL